jgi:hypothetical protein
VARKKAPPAPPLPPRDRALKSLRSGDFAAAIAIARQLLAAQATTENLALLKTALTGAAADLAERNKVIEFNRIMDEADGLDPDDPSWAAERACLLARGGRLADALMRADEFVRPRVLGHAADRALRYQSKEFLPDELHPGYNAVLTAFRHYEEGNEAAAREALEAIGLRSPFLEWKVLLRGLLAHSGQEDARAAENLGRLDQTRLPYRLAAPFLAVVDPAWKDTLPGEFASKLLIQHEKLNASPIVEGLREIARHLGRDRPLTPVFRQAETLITKLKQQAPQLIPRLANCLYHAIVHQGQPDDLPRYRRVFGTPPHDPGFFKLQALVAEQMHSFDRVHSFWKKFDDWLATSPSGWPPALLSRARATVWLRMGDNAEAALAAGDEADDDSLLDLFGPQPREQKAKTIDAPPADCYRRAVELAPDWAEPARELYLALVEHEPAEAEAVARELLRHQPDNLEALQGLGKLLLKGGRGEEAAALFLRASALNPLDGGLRRAAASAILAHARSLLIQSNAEGVAPLLGQYSDLLNESFPAARDCLASVAAIKLRQPEAAASLRERALGVKGARLAAAYRIMVDSQLAKLKPAEKRAADQFFAGELTRQVPTPMEVTLLNLAYTGYISEGLSYRGQKAHDKKLLDQADRCIGADAPDIDFEMLALVLKTGEHWKRLKKFCDACIRRFASNPVFLVLRSEAGFALEEREYYLEIRLTAARRLAEASGEPRFRALLPQIEELLKEVALPFSMFESFFGRRR